MTFIHQAIDETISVPFVTWRTDRTLEDVRLRFPLNDVVLCPQPTIQKGQATGIILEWEANPDATFYVVQLSPNNSFSGPSAQAYRVITTTLALDYLDILRLGKELSWRVFAYDSSGGTSISSQVRTFKLSCPEGEKGVNYNPEESVTNPKQLNCDFIGAKLTIHGDDTLRFNETQRFYALSVDFNCKTVNDFDVVVTDVEWSVDQPTSDPIPGPPAVPGPIGIEIVSQTANNKHLLEVKTGAIKKPMLVEIKAEVTFDLVGAPGISIFTCEAARMVLIEGKRTSSSVEIFEFEIDAVDCEVPFAEVTPIRAVCGGNLPSGSPLIVYDDLGCMLSFPEAQLIGSRGYAIRMEDPGLDDPSNSECHWAILALCSLVPC